ncbi:AAA family ATPase [uncultured Rikenella sp.]|uniref:AAA family ATPase n=1 Tax=uncultured Rikenella sp. TaxID=368003 RepID=UPI0026032736|nr:AAA family ATPase [uncultured Rikenella sp.]
MNNLRDQLSEHLERNRISQEAAAAGMGISGSALSAWRKEKYNGDNARIDALVVEYLGRQIATAVEVGTFKRDFDFVETTVYDLIRSGVDLAEARGEIRPVLGISGIGKTTALKQIRDEKQTAIFVQVYKGIRKNRFLSKVCKAAGISDKGTFDDLFESLADQLSGTGRLIIIDEAEHLPIDALDAVRRINDFTGCGIVLVGLPVFYELLRRYPYIYNRTAMPIRLDRLKKQDVSKMIDTMCPNEVPAEVWHQACAGVGRDLKMIALESMRVASLNGVEMTDTGAMIRIINQVTKELGRAV